VQATPSCEIGAKRSDFSTLFTFWAVFYGWIALSNISNLFKLTLFQTRGTWVEIVRTNHLSIGDPVRIGVFKAPFVVWVI